MGVVVNLGGALGAYLRDLLRAEGALALAGRGVPGMGSTRRCAAFVFLLLGIAVGCCCRRVWNAFCCIPYLDDLLRVERALAAVHRRVSHRNRRRVLLVCALWLGFVVVLR